MEAKHTDFTLRSTKYNDVAFSANNMRSFVDYEEHTGRFTSNDTLTQTLLPALGFSAWVDQYTWQWDNKLLALDNSKSMETQGTEALTLRERNKRLDRMPGALFQSTDPALKDIRFHAINSLYLNYRRGVSANTADFGLGDGYLYLHGRYIKNIDNSLRGHSRLACINQTLAYDTANRSNESTISKVLLRYFKLRLCLSHLTLYLYPLNLGQRSVVVQHLVSL